MTQKSAQETFTAALEALVDQVKHDRSVLAALLCGSLAHDVVWRKSDIDLVLVTIDDRQVKSSDLALDADGVNVHTMLMPRSEFRKAVEGSLQNSFVHSFLAKGRLLYTHDSTIADLCTRLQSIGTRDTAVQLLHAACGALSMIHKAHKWFITRGDLDYAALWILYAATPLAQVEVIGSGALADREVIPQALALNPDVFKIIYSDLLNERKSRQKVKAALDTVDAYVAARAPRLFPLVIDYLREAAEARSCTEIDNHFTRNFNVSGVSTACEYLADQGLIGRASLPVQLTRKSNVQIQELAFFFTAELPGC